ncbi:hypothetical protein [Halorarum salinum]|uniref:Uncharacterized protein n=1 Tax=Halorarum salinum TaxID=2743089 RepID=A0A7D5QE80_9EURY|nr:hypothetical protein [Halobaculum salinum]QLG60502.1 hypothetical protein HUG12_01550 [Halobaculum salinum]
MALKPNKRQAVLLQERIQEALHNSRLPEGEKAELREFNADLKHYLR